MMLSLFNNTKKSKPDVENAAQDRIAKNIVVKFLQLQQRLAMYMQQHTERLSVKRKVIVLFLFCLCGAAFSFLFIAGSLLRNDIVSFRVIQFESAPHIGKSGDEKAPAKSIVSKKEYEKIQHFRRHMDSLMRTQIGKRVYDSMLMNRPGLMDSIILIENIYQSQIKK